MPDRIPVLPYYILLPDNTAVLFLYALQSLFVFVEFPPLVLTLQFQLPALVGVSRLLQIQFGQTNPAYHQTRDYCYPHHKIKLYLLPEKPDSNLMMRIAIIPSLMICGICLTKLNL